jgi:hypothetical protein
LKGITHITQTILQSIQVNREIRADIEVIEKNAALYVATNFRERARALDYLEFNVIDRINGLLPSVDHPEELAKLKLSAERLTRRLEKIDEALFRQFRECIRSGNWRGNTLKTQIDEYFGGDVSQQNDIGYDSLDMFIDGVLLVDTLPAETKKREPEMYYYQQTPARVIFELIEKAVLTSQDVFYDLGSGLGQIPILVELLGAGKSKGIEFEPAYCDYARECAAQLNLPQVDFINEDARDADFSDGTVFYMYTPFEGKILQEVLEKLRQEACKRTIRLFTYGYCTPQVARQNWLTSEKSQNTEDIYKLVAFTSL